MKHILISRVDNIGDVILTLPMAGILKQHFPACKITLLARDYVRDIAKHCVYIDTFESWDALSSLPLRQAVAHVKTKNIDAVIHVSPKKSIATIMKKAGVPVRIGTARRWYHWLTCSKKVSFSRAKSELHEAQLNLKLLQPFSINTDHDLRDLQNYIGLQKPKDLAAHLKEKLIPNKFHLIIHPFTNGNTREWPISQFIDLIQSLPREQVVTASYKLIDLAFELGVNTIRIQTATSYKLVETDLFREAILLIQGLEYAV